MPNIIIGLGGTGTHIADQVRKAMEGSDILADFRAKTRFVGIDTSSTLDNKAVPEGFDKFVHCPVPDPNSFVRKSLERDREFRKWWPDPYRPAFPIIDAANQVRVNGRLALYIHAAKVAEAIQARVNELMELRILDGAGKPESILILIICSLSGGTGSGMFIDVAAITRKIVGPTAPIFSVILDPSVFDRVSKESFQENGYAALTELDYWMERPDKFEFKYPGYRIAIGDLGDRFIDCNLLIQETTGSMRGFAGTATGNPLDDYKLLMKEIVIQMSTNPGLRDYFINNMLVRLVAEGKPSLESGWRSRLYGSAGMTYLTFPLAKAKGHCLNRVYLESLLPGLSDRVQISNDEDSPDDFLSKLEVREADNKHQLTAALAKLFSGIKTRFITFSGNLQKRKNGEECADLIRQEQLDAAGLYNYWENEFKRISGEVETRLNDKFEKFARELRSRIDNNLEYFSFKDALNFIAELDGCLEADAKVINDKVWRRLDQLSKSGNVEELKQTAASFRKLKRRKLRQARERYISLLKNWLEQKELEAEYCHLAAFIQKLKKEVDVFQDAVKFLADLLNPIEEQARREIGSKRRHENVVDLLRLEKGEYPLDLEIGGSRAVMDSAIYPCIKMEDSVAGSVMSELWNGTNELKGLGVIFSEILSIRKDGDSEEDTLSSMAELSSAKTKFSEQVELLLNAILDQKISGKLEKSVGIDDAIDGFVEDTRAQLEEYRRSGNQRGLADFIGKLGKAIGEQEAQELAKLDSWRGSRLDEWKKRLGTSLIKNLADLLEPLWVREEFSGKPELIIDKWYAMINPKSRWRNAIPKADRLQCVEKDRIVLFRVQAGESLNYLKLTAKLQDAYENGLRTSMPLHADRRFNPGGDYENNILREPAGEEADLYFLLGLGLGLIVRAGNPFYYIRPDGNRVSIGQTLPKAVDSVRGDWQHLGEFKRQLGGRIREVVHRGTGMIDQASVSRVKDIFEAASRALGEEPVTAGKELWNSLADNADSWIATLNRAGAEEEIRKILEERLG